MSSVVRFGYVLPRPDGRPLLQTAFDDADTEILSRFVLRVKSDDEGAVPSDWQAKLDAAEPQFARLCRLRCAHSIEHRVECGYVRRERRRRLLKDLQR